MRREESCQRLKISILKEQQNLWINLMGHQHCLLNNCQFLPLKVSWWQQTHSRCYLFLSVNKNQSQGSSSSILENPSILNSPNPTLSTTSTQLLPPTDPALWQMSNNLVTALLAVGSEIAMEYMRPLYDIARTERGKHNLLYSNPSIASFSLNDFVFPFCFRKLRVSAFYVSQQNGELLERKWLLYSLSFFLIYCNICGQAPINAAPVVGYPRHFPWEFLSCC